MVTILNLFRLTDVHDGIQALEQDVLSMCLHVACAAVNLKKKTKKITGNAELALQWVMVHVHHNNKSGF